MAYEAKLLEDVSSSGFSESSHFALMLDLVRIATALDTASPDERRTIAEAARVDLSRWRTKIECGTPLARSLRRGSLRSATRTQSLRGWAWALRMVWGT